MMEEHERKKERPGIRAFFSNLSAPMSLKDKVLLLLRNNAIKMRNQQSCCGHPGEPGC
jgi:hypothetical protein